MNEPLPQVRIWHHESGDTWKLAGMLGSYEGLTYKSVAYDIGALANLSAPYRGQALHLTEGCLVTVDWRGKRTTWWPDSFKVSTGEVRTQEAAHNIAVTGKAAIAMLVRADVWPDPTLGIKNQPEIRPSDPAPYRAATETVIKQLVTGNYVNNYGFGLRVPATTGLGKTTRFRPKFDNLLEVVVKKAKAAGLLVDVGLVNVGGDSATRARLTLLVSAPVDRRSTVRLSTKLGTVAAWESTSSAPTLTKAIVVDRDGDVRTREVVTTPESVALAEAWGGHWTARVVGPGSRDTDELIEAGQEAIANGLGGRSLSVVASEARGMRAFVHYDVGDIGTAEVEGLTLVDAITSIEVAAGSDGVTVTPTFGDPDAAKSFSRLTSLLRQVRRNVKHLERD